MNENPILWLIKEVKKLKKYYEYLYSQLSGDASSATWGNITGSLTNQTDLQSALDAKANSSTLTAHTSNTSNPHSVTKTQVGLGNVDNTSDASKPVSTATQTALNLKANLASPTFTGAPLAPTATTATNNTQIATTAFVHSVVSGVAVPAAANPSVAIGLAVSNGSASTFMRSDAAPAISQAIAPTWTGTHVFNNTSTFNGNFVQTGAVFHNSRVDNTLAVVVSATDYIIVLTDATGATGTITIPDPTVAANTKRTIILVNAGTSNFSTDKPFVSPTDPSDTTVATNETVTLHCVNNNWYQIS